MRKASLYFLMLFVLQCYRSDAQRDTTKTVSLDNFRMPTTPAASLLNMGAYSISRPTTPKGVSTALLSSLGSNGLQPNANFEFAPYWLKSRRFLTFDDYYGLKNGVAANEGQAIDKNMLRSLAISFATNKLNDQKDTIHGTNLSIGLRTQIFSGHASSDMVKAFHKLDIASRSKNMIRSALTRVRMHSQDSIIQKLVLGQVHFPQLVMRLQGGVTALLNINRDIATEDTAEVRSRAFKLLADLEQLVGENGLTGEMALKLLDSKIDDTVKDALEFQEIANADKSKVGFLWEVAIAGVQHFPDDSYNKSSFQKMGIWSTLSYRSEDQRSEFSLLLRKTFTNNDSASSNLDLGLSATRIVDKGFNYGLECIYRSYEFRYLTKDFNGNNITAIKSGSTYRLALNMEYKISEVISLNASIGKDFDGPFVTKNNFLSVIGANISLPTLAGLLTGK